MIIHAIPSNAKWQGRAQGSQVMVDQLKFETERDARGEDQLTDNRLPAPERLKSIARAYLNLHFDTLMTEADQKWPAVTAAITVSDLGNTTMSELAEMIDLSWPRARPQEAIVHFLEQGSPANLMNIYSLGKRKVATIVTGILTLGEFLLENETCQTFDITRTMPPPELPVPTNLVHRIDFFWREIVESLTKSEFNKADVGELALRWGLEWPTNTDHLSMSSLLSSEIFSRFGAENWGYGKIKMRKLAEIIWHAWAEAEPGGPAGISKSPEEIAENQIASLPSNSDTEAILFLAFDQAKINKRERAILASRYGLGGVPPMTLEEVGSKERVTRERIRQVEEMASNRLRTNLVTSCMLKMVLKRDWLECSLHIQKHTGSPLVTPDCNWNIALNPSQRFLADVLFGNPRKMLDHLADENWIQRTSMGWWLGQSLTPESEFVANQCLDRMLAEGRPLPIGILARDHRLSREFIIDSLKSQNIRIRGGFAFPCRPTAAHRRSILSLNVAAQNNRYLWHQIKFHSAANSIDPTGTGSLRLLTRDLSAIPGIGIDLPGSFIVINSKAVEHAGIHSTDELPDEEEITDVDDTSESGIWENAADNTLAGSIESLLARQRIIRYEALEEMYCRADVGPPSSLGPTLLTRPQFVRYAPAYWGLAGLSLEQTDISTLCNPHDLRRYIWARRLGGLLECFPFWCPNMEYAWCRWAETNKHHELYETLLTVCDPTAWEVSPPIKAQWINKQKRFGQNRLPRVVPSLEKAFIDFDSIYGLLHLAINRGMIGPASIPHFYGLQDADRRSFGTMALLSSLGALQGRPDLDAPWNVGCRAQYWADQMSDLLIDNPKTREQEWASLLESEIEAIPLDEPLAWFSGYELKSAFQDWKAESI